MDASAQSLPVPVDYERVMNGDLPAADEDNDAESAEIISLDSFRNK